MAASDNPLAAWLSTWTIYGGAAHLVTLDVLAQGSGWFAAAVAGLLVQTRLSAYSTAMAPDWRTATLSQRLLAGVLLTDAPWALTRARETGRRGFYLGAGLTLFVAWPAMVTVGALSGDVLSGDAAALVPALVLGCTVASQLRHRPVLVAGRGSALSAVVTAPLSAGVALVAAAAAGTAGGLLADRATRGAASVPGRWRHDGPVAVALVGGGSLLLRVLPLLGAARIPDRVTVHAGRAGMAVLAATTVRTVVQHRDDSLTGASVTAPVLAALAVGLGLWLAYRGRSLLVAVAAGLASYLTLAAVLAAPN